MYDKIDVKERIKQSATELFLKNGYKGTSVRDIAAFSKTNPAMVNYYFGSKYDLFEEIFEESFELLISRLYQVIESDIPFFDMVERWVDVYYDTLLENPHIPAFLFNEINQNPERLSERLIKRNPGHIVQRFTAGIEAEIKSGRVIDMPATDVLLNIASTIVFPFIFGVITVSLSALDRDDYKRVLSEHRKWVVTFITNTLRCN